MKTEHMNVLPVAVLTDLPCYREVSEVSSVMTIADSIVAPTENG